MMGNSTVLAFSSLKRDLMSSNNLAWSCSGDLSWPGICLVQFQPIVGFPGLEWCLQLFKDVGHDAAKTLSMPSDRISWGLSLLKAPSSPRPLVAYSFMA